MSDDLEFMDEVDSQDSPAMESSWKILVVDDEESVHSITDLVFRTFRFEGNGLEILHAYSSQQARMLVVDHPDVAVIFLDVVMESDTSGLDLVRYIRRNLGNQAVRIILRTGQPGQAPEAKVIREYDINDYRLKTELTSQKLQTSLIMALRAYSRIYYLQESNTALLTLVENWKGIETLRDEQTIITEAATVLGALIPWNPEGQQILLCRWPQNSTPELRRFQGGEFIEVPLDEDTMAALEQAVSIDAPRYFKTGYAASFPGGQGDSIVLLYQQAFPLTDHEQNLLRIFHMNLTMALDNFSMARGLEQRSLPGLLGEIIHTLSKESGTHIQRISALAGFLGLKLGFTAPKVEVLRWAASLHDIGKVGIPDRILQKPSNLTHEEWTIVREHPVTGYRVLSRSTRELFQTGARIAHQHHERWDGTGYPQGLGGDQIDEAARIVALCDVYDSMCHARADRPAMHHEQVREYIVGQGGLQFDPRIVDVFNLNYGEIRALLDIFE